MLKETELYEKAVQRQSELKEELKSVEVSAELRQKLQAASQERRELLQLQNRLSEQEEELARHKGRLAESEQLEQELMYKRKAWEERLREWLSSCRAAYLVTSRLVQELERLLQTVPQLAERIREAGREAELRRMAADLARGLKRGEPCPVCGSRVHAGAVLHAEDDEADGGLERLRELDALQADARKRLAYVQQLRFMLHGLLRQALSGEADVADGGIVYGETAAASETANTAGIDGIRQQLQTAAEAGNRLAAQAAELEHALTDLLRESLTLDGQQREIRSAAQQLIHFIEGLEQKRLSLSKSLAERFEAWEQEFPGLRRDEVQQKLEELRLKDEKADELRQRIDKSVPFIDERLAAMERLRRRIAALELAVVEQRTKLAGDDMRLREKERQLADLTGGQSAEALIAAATRQLSELRAAADAAKAKLEQARERLQAAVGRLAAARQAHASAAQHAAKAEEEWLRALAAAPFADGKQVRDALLPEEVKAAWAREAEAHDSELAQLRNKLQELERQLQGRTVSVDEWEALKAQFEQLKLEDERALQNKAKAERDVEELNIKHGHWKELEERRMEKQTMLERLSKLQSVLRGNAFVEFIAEEQLMQVCRAASERLGALTRGKYAIEVDSGGGFVIRDNAGGGIRRPVTTLSGGEMFLTSLSLALALSAQIQLKGQYPLEFFFLDEGFGTLDQELLETVIAALEKLHMDNLTVGVISHVPELKNRLPRRLIVDPPEPGGRGSRVRIETF
jgi:exonuclease SbcC